MHIAVNTDLLLLATVIIFCSTGCLVFDVHVISYACTYVNQLYAYWCWCLVPRYHGYSKSLL